MGSDFLKQKTTSHRYPTDFLIGDLLIKAGVISPQQLEDAVRLAGNKHVHVGQMLIMAGNLTARDLQFAVDAQSALRDKKVDFNIATKCLKICCKTGCSFDEAVQREHASSPKSVVTQVTHKLGELLLDAELINFEQFSKAMQRSLATGLPLGRMLVLNGALTEDLLVSALEIQVRIRDEMLDRSEAIENLRTAGGLNADGGLFGQGMRANSLLNSPRKKGVRLGDLLVQAGFLSESDVMNSLEQGLVNDEPIGAVMVYMGYITQDILEAALVVQSQVDQGAIDVPKACELLQRRQQTGENIEEIIQEEGPNFAPSVSEEYGDGPLSIEKLLTLSRVITQEQFEDAFNWTNKDAETVAKVLAVVGTIDYVALRSILRCNQLMGLGMLSSDDAVIALDYCMNQAENAPIPLDEALQQLGWEAPADIPAEANTAIEEISYMQEAATTAPAQTSNVFEEVATQAQSDFAIDGSQEVSTMSLLDREVEADEVSSQVPEKSNGDEKSTHEESFTSETIIEAAVEAEPEAPAAKATPEAKPSSSQTKVKKLVPGTDSLRTVRGAFEEVSPEEQAQAIAASRKAETEELANLMKSIAAAEGQDLSSVLGKVEDSGLAALVKEMAEGQEAGKKSEAKPAHGTKEVMETAKADLERLARNAAEVPDQEETEAVEQIPFEAEVPAEPEVVFEEVAQVEVTESVEIIESVESEIPVQEVQATEQVFDQAFDQVSEPLEEVAAPPAFQAHNEELDEMIENMAEPLTMVDDESSIVQSLGKEPFDPMTELLASMESLDEPAPASPSVPTEKAPEPVAAFDATATGEVPVFTPTFAPEAAKAEAAKVEDIFAELKQAAQAEVSAARVSPDPEPPLPAEAVSAQLQQIQKEPEPAPAPAPAAPAAPASAPAPSAVEPQPAAFAPPPPPPSPAPAAPAPQPAQPAAAATPASPPTAPAASPAAEVPAYSSAEETAHHLPAMAGNGNGSGSLEMLTAAPEEQEQSDLSEALIGGLVRLAESYFEQSDFAQAQGAYERIVALRESTVGPDHPALVEDMNKLANVLCIQGNTVAAEPYVIRVVSILEKAQPYDALAHAEGLSSLAGIYYIQTKYAEAEPLLARSLKLRQDSLGIEHPDIADSLRDYAKLLKKVGRIPEAEKHYALAKAIIAKAAHQPVAT